MTKKTAVDTKENKQSTLLRIFYLIFPYKFRLILNMICAFIVVWGTVSLPRYSGRLIDIMLDFSGINYEKVSWILLKMLLIVVATALSQYLMNLINYALVYNIVKDLRTAAFDKLQKLPIAFLDAKSSGGIISNIVNDVDQFSEGLLMGFSQLFTGILTIMMTLYFIFSVNIKLGLIVVLITPFSMLLAAQIAKKTFVHFKNQAICRANMTAVVEEMIGGISTVKAYGMEDEVGKSFKKADEDLRQAGFKALFYSSTTNPTTRFVNALVYACVGFSGAFSALAGSISVGDLTCVLSYAIQYSKPFNDISAVIAELQNSIACASRVFELLDREEETETSNPIRQEAVKGKIALKNVDFSYHKDGKFIENMNINVRQGEKIAIVGPTGCGKTTIINLLMRFYEIQGGSIEIDDVDIRKLSRESLTGSFGMVLQDTWLKNATVWENISLGRKGAKEEDIISAAKEAYADGFIRRLPKGYDTIIGERGSNLSAGQKQLLCIARIMLHPPAMLILDEATSSIDTMTELRIKEAFDKMMRGRTAIIIAHRLSTVKNADCILVMRDGSIVERGKHEELLAIGGFYAKLYQSQYMRDLSKS